MSESTLAQDVAQIKKTLYFGNGEGALVTRMTLSEDKHDVTEKRMDDLEGTMKSWKSLALKFLIGTFALAATNLARIAFEIAEKHFH